MVVKSQTCSDYIHEAEITDYALQLRRSHTHPHKPAFGITLSKNHDQEITISARNSFLYSCLALG